MGDDLIWSIKEIVEGRKEGLELQMCMFGVLEGSIVGHMCVGRSTVSIPEVWACSWR